MCCNSPGVPGQRRVARPQGPRQQTVQRKWVVTYRENGETVTKEYAGGRSQELAAHRQAALHKGSVRMETTRVTPKPDKKTAKKTAAKKKGATK